MTFPIITVLWNKDEKGAVSYNSAYRETYHLLRLDMLKDAINALTIEYNSQLEIWHAEFKQIRMNKKIRKRRKK